jgi:AcrR family transcriptional regulator
VSWLLLDSTDRNNGYDVIIIPMRPPLPHVKQDAPAPGTPGWWATRPTRPTERRRGRPPRSFERIVAAASELVDEVGIGGFHMRLLAVRLDTSTATLYRHVAGKEELMVYVVDRLLAEVAGVDDGEEKPPRTWRDAARRASLRFHHTLSEHPNVLPLLVTQVPVGPNGLAVRERIISSLVEFGFSPRLAARAYTTLAHYVIGFAVQRHASGAPGRDEATALGDYYRRLDPELYPWTIAAADDLTAVSLEEEFLEGLEFIIDGIDRARRRRRVRAS